MVSISLKPVLVYLFTDHKINLQQNISFEEKAFHIRKFRGKIAKLKRGELVNFED